jgi:hypothetical protein
MKPLTQASTGRHQMPVAVAAAEARKDAAMAAAPVEAPARPPRAARR